ncbi:hypothetical protein EVAR_79542_1 [Eumeta japonica]|uniref:Uncharacterized protein n=1 Tax=Eumeta variegata TaxID=151549 RepID=A0A4C1Y704_EUMVA|nr:hypothetical protein EVAR_79542_1 [Eumeta japonica]
MLMFETTTIQVRPKIFHCEVRQPMPHAAEFIKDPQRVDAQKHNRTSRSNSAYGYKKCIKPQPLGMATFVTNEYTVLVVDSNCGDDFLLRPQVGQSHGKGGHCEILDERFAGDSTTGNISRVRPCWIVKNRCEVYESRSFD